MAEVMRDLANVYEKLKKCPERQPHSQEPSGMTMRENWDFFFDVVQNQYVDRGIKWFNEKYDLNKPDEKSKKDGEKSETDGK